VLKSYIGEKQAGSNRSAQYHCSYDPRDLSYIYFYDAEAKVYHKIPCANGSRPPISLWEYRAVSKRIRSHPDHVINEDAIYKGHEEMECIRQEAIAKTNQFKSRRAAVKRQLRTAERRLGWAGVHQQESTVATLEIETEVAETEDMIFEPFDDIDLR
jgi:putative transposase